MDSNGKVKFDSRRSLPAVDRLARAVVELRLNLPDWAINEAARASRSTAGRDLRESNLTFPFESMTF